MRGWPSTAYVRMRCARTRADAVAVFRRQEDTWLLSATQAAGRGVTTPPGRTDLSGGFGTHPEYAGCTSCKAPSFVRCGCGELGCWDGESRMFHCPWCGQSGALSGYITDLRASNG